MDHKKQSREPHDQQSQAQHDRENQREQQKSSAEHPQGSSRTRDQAEGSRENVNTERTRRTDERGRGTQNERNSGISNRGMDRSSEQEDLPPRGSSRESER